jgi:hypothetical protein
LQERQRKSRRLAGAGLCAGEQILALEHQRYGLLLNGRGGIVALFLHGAEQFGRKTEILE